MKQMNCARALGAVSFALSLLGFLCLTCVVFVRVSELWFSVGCVVLSVTALILGAVSRKSLRSHNPLALAGFIISIVTLALFVILWTLILALFFFFADIVHWLSGLGRIG